jgi:hypothetical protein
MLKELIFKVSGGTPGGFVAEGDGYFCFVEPVLDGGFLEWSWCIQSGGGWGARGDEPLVKHAEGLSLNATMAIEDILEELKLKKQQK